MEDSFVDLLQSLTNDTEPVDGVRLAELSDMDSERLEMFSATWEHLPDNRRLALLKELGLTADAQIELTFEPINRFALNDAEPSVRQQAIENLWESEAPGLARSFVQILRGDPHHTVRGEAGKALGAFVFIAETRELDLRIQEEMEEGLLHAARNDSSREVRDLCLRSLGFSSRPEVPNLIEEAFAAVGESRIAAALCAMARSANEAWGENVLAHLQDGSPIIRLEAIRAAGEIGLDEGVPELIELLEDVDEPVRRAAIWSLSQIGGMKASEVLNSLAETELNEDEQETLQDAIDNLVFADGSQELVSFDQDDAQDPLA
jgi:HEAT repeats